MSKKSSKKKPVAEKAESKAGAELSEKELEQVAGGAGVTPGKKVTPKDTKQTPTESISFGFSKIETT